MAGNDSDSPAARSVSQTLDRDGNKPPSSQSRDRRWLVWAIAVLVILATALALGLGLGLGLDTHENRDGPVVDLGYARYRGSYLSNDASQYLGMRFAHPPTGNLRWRGPIEPKNETDVRDASKFGPICLGISESISDREDEDCLFVNVWAPTNATLESKLPVMVFIQGGGYTKNANANWNGSQLVETSNHNIVFVNFNYRAGLWGFLASEQVRGDGDLNAGLLDQRFLLRWVQKYITHFGGDPNHVVIQGISAGAGSVALHLIANDTQPFDNNSPLFAGAIAESTFFPAQQPVAALETQFNDTLRRVKCLHDNASDRMPCLRGRSAKELQSQANQPARFAGESGLPLFYWTPCIDGELLADFPSLLFDQGKALKVPLLFGTCTNEGSGFAPNANSPSDVATFFESNFPSISQAQADRIPDHYPLEPSIPRHNAWFPSASRAYGEATFVCPTNLILDSLCPSNRSNTTTTTNNSAPALGLWSYRYNVDDAVNTENGLGVPHVYESTAVFGPGMLPMGPAQQSYHSYNAPIVPVVMRYWLSFVRALDPNPHRDAAAPAWQPWGSLGRGSRMVLQTNSSKMETVGDGQKDRCRFWDSLGTSMQQK